jgi:hypothetical protein
MVTPSKSAANPNAATSLLEFEVRKIAAITKTSSEEEKERHE